MDRHPDITPTHPGELLREDILPEVAATKTAIAKSLGISRQQFYAILRCEQPVTAPTAIRLGKLFGNSPQFWMNMQSAYDLAIASKSVDVSEIKTLEVA